jgi:hypothetical protein
LPYSNHKRDETFSEEDSNKIAPVFTHTEIPSDPEKAFTSLREYLTMYKSKKPTYEKSNSTVAEEKKQV